mgnify:FL=1
MTNWNNKVLYAGVTNNILIRTGQHKVKFMKGFTAKYNVNKLVFFEGFSYVRDAIAAEKKIKGWTRAKKIKLIESKNPNWEDLSKKLEFYSGSL